MTNKIRSSALIFISLLLVFIMNTICANAETIKLRSEEIIQGRITRMTNDSIDIKIDDAKAKTILISDILTIDGRAVNSFAVGELKMSTSSKSSAPAPSVSVKKISMEIKSFQKSPAGKVLGGISMVVVIIINLILWIIVCLPVAIMAKKRQIKPVWWAYVPILNALLMLKLANKSLWWFFLFLIPLVNIIVIFVVWMEMFAASGKPSWLGLLMILPLINFIVLWYVALTMESTNIDGKSANSSAGGKAKTNSENASDTRRQKLRDAILPPKIDPSSDSKNPTDQKDQQNGDQK